MTEQTTSAVPRYCASCGIEIDWQEATWVMTRGGRLQYYHAGCDLPPGTAAHVHGERNAGMAKIRLGYEEASGDGESGDKK